MSDNYQTVTRWLLGAVAVGLAAYDVAPFLSDTDGDTISEVVRDAGATVASVPFAVGFLVGHFFWPGDRKLSHGAALSIGAALAALAALLGWVVPAIPSVAFVAVGALAGRLLWPLKSSDG